jgi:hypothetical protein
MGTRARPPYRIAVLCDPSSRIFVVFFSTQIDQKNDYKAINQLLTCISRSMYLLPCINRRNIGYRLLSKLPTGLRTSNRWDQWKGLEFLVRLTSPSGCVDVAEAVAQAGTAGLTPRHLLSQSFLLQGLQEQLQDWRRRRRRRQELEESREVSEWLR